MDNQIRIDKAQAHRNTSGTRILYYTVEIHHDWLSDYKLVSGPDMDILQNKVNLQIQKWELSESKRKNKEEKEASLEEATSRTIQATNNLKEIDDLLIHTLSINDAIDREKLKKIENYTEKAPHKPTLETKEDCPQKPEKEIITFNSIDNFLEKIFKFLKLNSLKERKIQKYEDKYLSIISKREENKKNINNKNLKIEKNNEEKLKKRNNEILEWENRKGSFLKEQEEFNLRIKKMEEDYFKLNPSSIIEYCDMVLNNSDYPESFPKSYELEYNPDNKILIIEYQLPRIESFPKIKEVKYIASKRELRENNISESQLMKIFNDSIYKITLRTIHELFEADLANALDAISFNWWVKAINKGTGKEENNCILSIQVKKSDFIDINLSNIDPKYCFKSLKGVASSELSSITPIAPILQISRTDKRFVENHEITNKIDTTTNLAAMDWEDFEHLIRELFEKEFQWNGGEVKVTQASRDGGVDAVAFDPDPIRGGKIVIQAKRYTNTVGVSAVRDLYGTVMNEGATKGLLVSTANYGPDAYEFAKGKPLTLLNGSNLLHLLEKHWYHAKINLWEAKKDLVEKEKMNWFKRKY